MGIPLFRAKSGGTLDVVVLPPMGALWLAEAVPRLELLKVPKVWPCELWLVFNKGIGMCAEPVLHALVMAEILPKNSPKYIAGTHCLHDPNESPGITVWLAGPTEGTLVYMRTWANR